MVQVMPPIKATIDMDALLGVEHSDEPARVPRLNNKQFQGYTGGPEEAGRRAFGARHAEAFGRLDASLAALGHHEDVQGQLFDPSHIPLQEAHHQTPEQFARDPRTWWHGRVTKGGARSSLGGSTVGRGEGFHAGTEGAARQRVTTNVGRRGLGKGMAGRMYPLRITGPVDPPEEAKSDVPIHRELGPRRQMSYGGEMIGGRASGYLYKNEVEGGGAMSVGVPKRKGFMSTQREMVRAAKKSGQFVHPNIEWATQKQPEHTAEEIVPRFHHATPAGMRVAEQHLGYETAKASDPERMERTSYQTQSGGTQHVYRYRDPSKGSALNPKQWDRGEYKPPPNVY